MIIGDIGLGFAPTLSLEPLTKAPVLVGTGKHAATVVLHADLLRFQLQEMGLVVTVRHSLPTSHIPRYNTEKHPLS